MIVPDFRVIIVSGVTPSEKEIGTVNLPQKNLHGRLSKKHTTNITIDQSPTAIKIQ